MHRELNPRCILVCALSEGRVIGYAVWIVPVCLSRSETFGQFIYRKAIGYKDAIENWLFPPIFRNQARRNKYRKVRTEYEDRFLGKGKCDEMWYLLALAVHPDFQRKGVGGELLQWGLKQAQDRGEKVYLEATEAGFGLYSKKGFDIVGMMVVRDKEDEMAGRCMLWTPSQGQTQ
jgi:GNAT superfamily N-acetyltransferase